MSLVVLLATSNAVPTSPGFSLSDAIAIVALVLSFAAVIVPLFIHKDSGGRVTVSMRAAAYQPRLGRFIVNSSGELNIEETQEPSVELCQVVIENPGRVGVTVTDVMLNVDRGDGVFHGQAPRAFILKGFAGEEVSGKTHFRIDPYDRQIILFDYWSAVDSAFAEDPRLSSLHVSAEAKVAGRAHPYNSTKSGHWRIMRDRISSFGSGKFRRPRNLFLLETLRQNTSRLDLVNHLGEVAIAVEQKLESPASIPSWEEALISVFSSPESEMMKHQWNKELDRRGYFPTYALASELARQGERLGEKFRPYPKSDGSNADAG